MKKIIIVILVIVITIVSIMFAKIIDYTKKKNEIQKLNNEFLAYENSNVQINTVVSLMNRAIQSNTENEIQKDEKGQFIENDKNSIKLFLEIESRGSIIPMEDLILGEKAGIEKVSYAFSDILFKISNVEYHEKTGQVKKITFTAIENEAEE